jgi:hypothetical protein
MTLSARTWLAQAFQARQVQSTVRTMGTPMPCLLHAWFAQEKGFESGCNLRKMILSVMGLWVARLATADDRLPQAVGFMTPSVPVRWKLILMSADHQT